MTGRHRNHDHNVHPVKRILEPSRKRNSCQYQRTRAELQPQSVNFARRDSLQASTSGRDVSSAASITSVPAPESTNGSSLDG